MRSARLLPPILALLAAAALFGCAERPNRLVGNERLIRGSGGFGTTGVADTTADRDTYVAPRTAFNDTTLLAGRIDTYEARTLLRVGAWSLPDTTDPSLIIDAVRFEIDYDATIGIPVTPGVTLELRLAGAAWDSTKVEWPGPALGALLGTAIPADQVLSPFQINLGAGGFDLLKSWARDPGSAPGFVLAPTAGEALAGFRAGTGRFTIVGRRTVSGTVETFTTRSNVTNDLTIHTPPPAATGTETLLLLGGLFRAEAAIHVPVPYPGEGFSINEARLVVYVASQGLGEVPSMEVQALRIGAAWDETVQADSSLALASTPVSVVRDYTFAGADSLVFSLPASLVRGWLADSSSNHGVLLRVKESYLHPELRLYSRESARPPVLQIGITSPPPGRF